MIFFFKVDLKTDYHHLDILEIHQKYLGFSWIIDGIERFFVFTVLVFGLASAPFIFTKVVRMLIRHWRGMAIRIFAFVDDFLSGAKSREEAAEASAQVKGDLECSGFIVCPEKTQWHPVQKGEHLGYFVDLQSGVISVPAVRTPKLKERIASLVPQPGRLLVSLALLFLWGWPWGLWQGCGLGPFIIR